MILDKVDKLKKIIFLLITLALSWGLFAQSGLFNLSYGMPLDEADTILATAGFRPEGSEKNAVKYYSDINEFVAAILVSWNPKPSGSQAGSSNTILIMAKITTFW